MTDPVAEQVFKSLGQEFSVPGIWREEQLEALEDQIQALIASSKAQEREAERALEQAREDAARQDALNDLLPQALPIGLSRRLVPILKMIQRARAEQEPIVWERS